MVTKSTTPIPEKFSVLIEYKNKVAATGQVFVYSEDSIAHIHNKVSGFNKEVYKKMLVMFEELKLLLRDNGIKLLATYSTDMENKMLPKYWRMFGFGQVNTIIVGGVEMLYTEMEV